MNKRKYEFALELKKEMEQKPFSKISISDLCESLNYSRQSFYYYYSTLRDCLSDYVKLTLNNQIHSESIIEDLFNYFDVNSDFVHRCFQDEKARELLWKESFDFLKRSFNAYCFVNVPGYSSLSAPQKEYIDSFYAAGILNQAWSHFLGEEDHLEKSQAVMYCRAILGSKEDLSSVLKRLSA